jgi:SAM-dependent methyltransferase
MLTVDFDRLRLPAAARILDLGCGAGRHAFELYRRGARVVAVDWSASEVVGVRDMFDAMREAGEVPAEARAGVARSDALHLPFPDAVFDAVVAAEVLEHIADDTRAIAELARVVKPGGTIVVTVPRWWPERVCWALSTAYHQVEGGHVRIYRRRDLLSRLNAAALQPQGSHHAHALHSPYWWLRCAYGPDNNKARLPRLYHQMLVYDIMHRPWWTRTAERLLNPLLGKSLVVYLTRPC